MKCVSYIHACKNVYVCTGSFFKNLFITKNRTQLFESCSSGVNKMSPGNRSIKTGPPGSVTHSYRPRGYNFVLSLSLFNKSYPNAP